MGMTSRHIKAMSSLALKVHELKEAIQAAPGPPAEVTSQVLYSLLGEGINLVESTLFVMTRETEPAFAHRSIEDFLTDIERMVSVLLGHTDTLKRSRREPSSE